VADPTPQAEGFLKTYQPMAVSVLQDLQDWFGLKAREAEEALIAMFPTLLIMWEGVRGMERDPGGRTPSLALALRVRHEWAGGGGGVLEVMTPR